MIWQYSHSDSFSPSSYKFFIVISCVDCFFVNTLFDLWHYMWMMKQRWWKFIWFTFFAHKDRIIPRNCRICSSLVTFLMSWSTWASCARTEISALQLFISMSPSKASCGASNSWLDSIFILPDNAEWTVAFLSMTWGQKNFYTC